MHNFHNCQAPRLILGIRLHTHHIQIVKTYRPQFQLVVSILAQHHPYLMTCGRQIHQSTYKKLNKPSLLQCSVLHLVSTRLAIHAILVSDFAEKRPARSRSKSNFNDYRSCCRSCCKALRHFCTAFSQFLFVPLTSSQSGTTMSCASSDVSGTRSHALHLKYLNSGVF